MQRIPERALDVLHGMEFDGEIARLTAQLDRPTYEATNKVLEALGGKWNRKQKGHVFTTGDPRELIGDALTLGGYIDQKKEMQFFPTPPELADQLVRYSGAKRGHRVLEPSAGDGAIVLALIAAGVAQRDLTAVELDGKHASLLGDLAGTLFAQYDFLQLSTDDLGTFDAVVMNPPFTRSQDIAHVLHAWDFVRPGGMLVAVMGVGWQFRQDRKARDFREWVSRHTICEPVENEPGTFKASGTMVRTVTVVAGKA